MMPIPNFMNRPESACRAWPLAWRFGWIRDCFKSGFPG